MLEATSARRDTGRVTSIVLLLCGSVTGCGPLASNVSATRPCVPVDNTGAPASTLSGTGCFGQAGEPGAELRGYQVNAPLWANGAGKDRWLFAPHGAALDANGVVVPAPGSAVFKEFALDGVRLETRMLVRDGTGGWTGYSYAWDAGQEDATLLADGATQTIEGHTWTFPSRTECTECHNAGAGVLLGLRVPELSLAVRYGKGVANQLVALEKAGVLTGALPAAPETWPNLASDAPVSARARAYLAANCSFCHRPGGPSGTATDYRFDTPLAQMGICNVPPTRGDFGIASAALVTPGDPNASVLSYRMHSVDPETRMPPIGRTQVDDAAVNIIDAWIASLKGCE